AVEGAEDDRAQGAADLAALGPQANDVVLLVAASGATPYALGAAETARAAGALTVAVVNNPGAPLAAACEIPIKELIKGNRLLFCEDSIVRGTQLKDTIERLFECGALEVHMRPACPPLIFGCPYLNFSRSRSELDLAGRMAILELEGQDDKNLDEYSDASSPKYHDMVEKIRKRLGLTSLKYQKLEDLVDVIGLPKEQLCTYCWDGCRGAKKSCREKKDQILKPEMAASSV
ncbi:Amidophosphoribosyltransferase precursor, partial [sediment metagenome]